MGRLINDEPGRVLPTFSPAQGHRKEHIKGLERRRSDPNVNREAFAAPGSFLRPAKTIRTQYSSSRRITCTCATSISRVRRSGAGLLGSGGDPRMRSATIRPELSC